MQLIHQKIVVSRARQKSKSISFRVLLKMPLLLLLLPAGLLLASISMIALGMLAVILLPLYAVQLIRWRFSPQGRIQHLKERYHRSLQTMITRERTKRLEFSQHSDRADLLCLANLINHEINQRKQHIHYIVLLETNRRLNRCVEDMAMENALIIYRILVETELDSLNDALNQLFQ